MAVSDVKVEVCVDCGGSGWVEVEGASDRVRRCSCRRRKGVDRLVDEADIPIRYQGCRLSTFRPTTHPAGRGRDQLVAALSRCRHYVESFLSDEDELRFRDTGLLFTGPPGAGKTHLAVAVLQELIATYGVQGRFVDFTALTQRLQAAFGRDSETSTSAILRPLERAELLVLDELGSQKLSAWTRDILYHLINGRYQRRLPTLFTTNYRLQTPAAANESLDRGPDLETAAALAHRIPPMLFSRLHEMARPVILDAVSDYRENRRHSV